MNLTIELSDEKAAALEAQAAALGLTVERWVEQIAEQPGDSAAHLYRIPSEDQSERMGPSIS